MSIAQQLFAEAHALWWAPWTGDMNADLKRHAEAMAKARAALTLIAIQDWHDFEKEHGLPMIGSSGAEDFQALKK